MTRMRRFDLPGDGESEAVSDGSLFFVGTATTLIRFGGFSVLTDPNFLHQGERVHLGYGLHSTRRTEPALQLEELPPYDFVLLSHLYEDHFDREVDTGAAKLGLTWNGGDALSLAMTGCFSPNEPIPLGPDAGTLTNRNVVTFVANYNITDNLAYVFQNDIGWQHDANAFTPGTAAEWYGINQYLFYTLSECWKAGIRAEWFRDDDGARVTGLRPGNTIAGESFAGHFFDVAVGLNWTPTANFIVRPELRYDWFDGDSLGGLRPYADGTRDDQWVAGFDVIFLW